MRKLSFLFSAILVSASLLLSCGPASTTTPLTTTAPPTTTTPPTTTAPPITPVKEEPQYGGTLIAMWSYQEPQSWDPNDAMWYTNPVASLYLEMLLVGDLNRGPRGTNETSFGSPDWVAEEYTIGQLAESWEWTDRLTLVMHLRKGIMWQRKPSVMATREFVADDVVFSLNRYILDPKRPPSDLVESLSARDKYTIVFKLKRFSGDWMNLLGWGYYMQIYPPELVKAGIKDWRNAVGTGPFILKDYVSGASLTYEKNPDYWGTTKVGGKEYRIPFVDRFVWPIIPDESTRLAALQTAKVDQAFVATKYVSTLEKTAPELVKWEMMPLSFPMMGMRPDRKPFDDIRVRRAMNMAIDRQAMINSLYEGKGVILSAPFSASWPESLYTPLEKLPTSAKELFEYNPEKAKELLAEAGYPAGFKTTLVCGNTPVTLDRNSMLVAYWKAIGVDVTLQPKDYVVLLTTMMGWKQEAMLETGKYNGTPMSILSIMGTSLTDKPTGSWNAACFWPPEFKERLDKAEATFDLADRNRQLKELNVWLIDQAPYVWLATSKSYNYWWPWVKNYYGEYSVGAGIIGPFYASIWLDRDLKEKMIGKR